MATYARLVGAVLALATTGLAPQPPQLLACHGDFGQFANGFLVARPMELDFVVDWTTPSVATTGGIWGRITALTALELAFDIQYEGYRATYRVNRVDGTISQRPNIGGAFSGNCELQPFTKKF
jgi:hypothetical protein